VTLAKFQLDIGIFNLGRLNQLAKYCVSSIVRYYSIFPFKAKKVPFLHDVLWLSPPVMKRGAPFSGHACLALPLLARYSSFAISQNKILSERQKSDVIRRVEGGSAMSLSLSCVKLRKTARLVNKYRTRYEPLFKGASDDK